MPASEQIELSREVELTPELVGCCNAVANQITATLWGCKYDTQFTQKVDEIKKPIYNLARAIIAQVREEMASQAPNS